MRVLMKKSGKSVSIRIPSQLMKPARFKVGDVVDVREDAGRIVIGAVSEPRYLLAELLSKVTPETCMS